MENQHLLIKTYRELSQTEIDLMNQCILLEAQFHTLHSKILIHVVSQCDAADFNPDQSEQLRLKDATPQRWLSIAKTDVEQGFMAMVRAVAQPSTPTLENKE